MGCGDVRLLRTIGGVDVTRQERAILNKLTMPFYQLLTYTGDVGQHGWCDTEAIGFLPQAVGLSRCQCERQPHGTSLSREAWNRPTPASPHAATAWRLRRCHAKSGLDRAGRRLCAGPL